MVARLAVVSKIITAGTHVAPLARSHQRAVDAEIRLGTAPAVPLQSLRPGTACATNVQDVQLRPVTAPAQFSKQVGHFARTHLGTDGHLSLLPASMPRELEPRRSQPHAAANHIYHRRDEVCENNVATNGFHNYHASHGNAHRQLDPRA
jgi:hypothetical protein